MTDRAEDSRWLILWDIDGTLLLDASSAHVQVMLRTLDEVHGIGVPRLLRANRAGMTDGQICREILVEAGIEPALIDRHVPTVVARASDDYDPGDLTATVNRGISDVLRELHERDDVVQSLVTGNYEQIARRKLTAAGVGEWFDPDIGGGFGSDHEQREFLPAVARQRAGSARRDDGSPWPASRTVIVGDTPRDIACARHDGVHVVAIATGPYAVGELADADTVVADAVGLRQALIALIDGPEPTPEETIA